MKFAVPLLASLLFSSCASYFIRQECDATDWYKYGQSVAMDGHRLSGDSKVHRCEKAGADVDDVALDHGFKEGMSNYCQPETVYQTGKRGEFFSPDMCEESLMLLRRHAEGVRQYCQKANGFAAGAVGKKYNGVCPKDLEAAFTPEFNRGRKTYLQATIAENENALSDIQNQIAHLESERFMTSSQLSALPSLASQTASVYIDPSTGQSYAAAAPIDPALQARRQDLEFELQTEDSNLFRSRQKAEELKSANRDLQVEMTIL